MCAPSHITNDELLCEMMELAGIKDDKLVKDLEMDSDFAYFNEQDKRATVNETRAGNDTRATGNDTRTTVNDTRL